jgi:hypothetical protein
MSITVNNYYNAVSMAEEILADTILLAPEAQVVSRSYETDFGAKNKGDTIDVEVPVRLQSIDGHVTELQTITTETKPFTVNNERHVAYAVKSTDRTLNKQAFYQKYLKPAAIAISEDIRKSIRDQVLKFSMFAGVPATTPASTDVISAMAKRLTKNGVPLEDRFLILDPDAYYDIQTGEKTISPEDIVRRFIIDGTLPQIKGFTPFLSNLVTTHTKGAGSSYVVDGADQTGKTLTVKTGTGALNAGDIITIASVNAVNPQAGHSLGFVREFVVTADYAGGGGDISIDPTLNATAPYATVDALPADAAVITQIATHVANMAVHREAIQFAMVDIVSPDTTPIKHMVSQDGFSLAVEIYNSGKHSADIIKVRALWAVDVLNPDFGARLFG